MADDSQPSTPAESHAGWAIPGTMDSGPDTFNQQVLAGLKCLFAKYPSPSKYLEHALDSPEKINEFANHLWTYYPEQDDTSYHHSARLEPTSEKDWAQTPPTCVHLCSLGFAKDCSLKPIPGTELWMQLTEQFLADGFLSSGEPLLVVQSVDVSKPEWKIMWAELDPSGPLKSFSLGYVKGMARVSCLFALLHFCWVEGLDIRVHHPVLWESVLRVWVHHVEHPNKVEEAIHTMKMSARGSIRKAVNVIQTAVMVQKLFSHGLSDFGAFVRKWNQGCARAFQIIGKKAMALKYLFESTPKEYYCFGHVQFKSCLIVDITSYFTFGCHFNGDHFACMSICFVHVICFID